MENRKTLLEPLVSVITPCYNGEKYLNELIQSIYQQTYKNIELIIVNDGSTDRTEEIILKWKAIFEKSQKFFLYLVQENQGQASAINKGIQAMSGKYMVWPDSDDILMRDSIEKRVRWLEAHPQYGCVRSNGEYFDFETGKIIGRVSEEKNRFEENLFTQLYEGKTFCSSDCYMVSTEILYQCYPEKKILESREGQNLQIEMPILSRTKCGFIDENLCRISVRKDSHSRKDSSFQEREKRIEELRKLKLEILPYCKCNVQTVTKRINELYDRNLLKLYFEMKDKNVVALYNKLKQEKSLVWEDRLLYLRYKFEIVDDVYCLILKMKKGKKIKSISNRLPGGTIYTTLKASILWNIKKPLGEYSYYCMLMNLKRAVALFFLGEARSRKLCKKLQLQLINRAKENMKRRKEFISFENIKIPIIQDKDLRVFCYEFVDIIAPYLYERRNNEMFGNFNYGLLSDAFIEGPYEYSDKVCLSKGDVVVDCGANIGIFSAVAANKNCKVYSFEPSFMIRNKYLQKTKSFYGEMITICPFALSDKTGKVSFSDNIESIGSSTLGDLKNEKNAIELVDAVTLDEWVKKNSISHIDFIKADIEGAERKMLLGAKEVLKKFHPKLSICTYHLPDDSFVLKDIILEANPNYIIEEKYMKMYAYVPD